MPHGRCVTVLESSSNRILNAYRDFSWILIVLDRQSRNLRVVARPSMLMGMLMQIRRDDPSRRSLRRCSPKDFLGVATPRDLIWCHGQAGPHIRGKALLASMAWRAGLRKPRVTIFPIVLSNLVRHNMFKWSHWTCCVYLDSLQR